MSLPFEIPHDQSYATIVTRMAPLMEQWNDNSVPFRSICVQCLLFCVVFCG